MKKRLLCLALSTVIIAALFAFATPAFAASSGTCGDNLTWTLDNNGTLTISGTGDMKNYSNCYSVPWYNLRSSIKAVVIANGVTSIGKYAFEDCTSLTSITIPDSVTSIGIYAFEDCSSLASITIPDSVTSIEENAFRNCSSLTSITIPDSVTSIGEAAFLCCDTLTSITIGNGVTSIGDEAFYFCESLTSITIPDSVTSIGYDAFEGTAYYNNKNNWDNGILYIGNHLIAAQRTVTNVTINENTCTIADYAFYNCTSLTSISIPDSVTSIGNSAFHYCTSLKSVTIGNSVKSIGDEAFLGCENITSITIGDSVTSIGYEAFGYCTSLASITLPDSVTSIDEAAFVVTAYYNNENNWDNGILYIGNHLIKAKSTVDHVTVRENTLTISNYAFYYYCTSLTSITIPDSVTSIGDGAFSDCTSLKTVYYNGTLSDWDKIKIGANNSPLTNATKKYFYYVTLLDADGNEINKIKCDINTAIDISELEKSGYSVHLYTDEECQNEFDMATSITENTVLQLRYIINQYTYKFLDENGTLLKEATADYGTVITPPENPTKQSTAQYTYTFAGWDGFTEGMTLNADKTFTATYSSTVNKYTYKFLNENGTVLKERTANYGTTIIPPANPTKQSTAQYTYTFAGWDGFTQGMTLSGNTSFTATYSSTVNQYTYKFLDEDGTVLKEDTADYGTVITPPENPTKQSTAQYTYTFAGWDGFTEGMTLSGNTSFTATYSSTVNQYTYKFLDEDGTVLKETTADYGTTITPPENPSKVSTAQYTYTFAGWDGFTEGMTLNADKTFTATYSPTVNQYTYKFLDEDGTVLKETTVDYGTVITPPENPSDKGVYTFDYWQNYTEGMTLTGDITFNAMYKYKNYSITAEGLPYTTTVTYNSNYTITPQALTGGYSFIGYFTEPGGKGTKITDKNGESLSVYNTAGNLNVYPYFESIYLNKIKVHGDTSVMPGGKIAQQSTFATDKAASYFTVTVKYPKYLEFKRLNAVDFTEAAINSEKTEGDYKYLEIACVYDYNGNNMPLNTNLIPFETVFDVTAASPVGSADISFEDAKLIGSSNYDLAVTANHTFEILPKLAESIEITGQSEIEGATQYTAIVSPDYTSDKTVIWSVDDETVATVTQDGTLTPVKNGTVTLTATAADGSGVYAAKVINVTAYAKITGLVIDGIDSQVEFDPDVREYTVYVTKDITEISITPTFFGGALRPNGSGIWISGQSKEFTLNKVGTTVITLNREMVTEMTNSVYTVNVIKLGETETNISEDGKNFRINPYTQVGNTVILALYNGSGLADIKYVVYDGNEIMFHTDQAYTSAKVMIWSGFDNLKPLNSVKKLK